MMPLFVCKKTVFFGSASLESILLHFESLVRMKHNKRLLIHVSLQIKLCISPFKSMKLNQLRLFTYSVDTNLTPLLFNSVESEADRQFNFACAKDLIHELTDQQNPTERKKLSLCVLYSQPRIHLY